MEIYSIAKSIGKKTSVEPKSGCKKINKIGIKNTNASFIQNLKLSLNLVILLRANKDAAITQVPIFAISEGCMEISPKSIQRVALYLLSTKGIGSPKLSFKARGISNKSVPAYMSVEYVNIHL